jgi:hypothetical protein
LFWNRCIFVSITLFGSTPDLDTVMSKQVLIFVCREEVCYEGTVRRPFLSVNTFIKPTRCTNFTNLFYHEILYVSDSLSVHHQEFIHCTFSNGMSYSFVDSFRGGPGWNCSILVLFESCLQTCMTYTIVECTVNKLLMVDSRTVRNM